MTLRKRIWAYLALLPIVISCASVQPVVGPAVGALQTACSLGLVRSPEVQAEAERLVVPVPWLAEALCAIPAVYETWESTQGTRADQTRAAVAAAEELELL